MDMGTRYKTRTVRLTAQDNEAIATLKAYYGLTSDNEVIRLALRVALREIAGQGNPTGAPNKERRISPPA